MGENVYWDLEFSSLIYENNKSLSLMQLVYEFIDVLNI